MKKTILIDIDDVINNLCEAWISYLNNKYNQSVSCDSINDWNMPKFFPSLTAEEVHYPLYQEDFWKTVTVKEGAVEYVKKLIDDGFEVFFCTATDYRNVRSKFEYIIQPNFPFISWNSVIVCYRKQMINADVLIDDGIQNLEGGNYHKILFDAPHNRYYNAEENGMIRVYGWEEAYDMVHKITRQNELQTEIDTLKSPIGIK